VTTAPPRRKEQGRRSSRVTPKSMSSTPIGDGNRFSEKVTRREKWLFDNGIGKCRGGLQTPLVPAKAGTQLWMPAFAGMSGEV